MSFAPLPRRLAVAATVVSLGAGLFAAPAVAQPPGRQRQRDFAAAAGEFGVPLDVLLGVSYLESRWDYNAGTPSTSAGYGPMHLTDLRSAGGAGTEFDQGAEDPRGDTARPALRPKASGPAAPPPTLQTADTAASLLRTDAATLRTDPKQNIRGGAALLADYQRRLGVHSQDPKDWYGAVARYSGSDDVEAARTFADEVFDTIGTGVNRTTDDGQQLTLAATPGLAPDRTQANRLGLRADAPAATECPRGVACESVPAPYQELPGGDYGNHDLANRPQSQKIDYIVIHDTEGYWADALKLVQDPSYLGWHYTVRSADGLIAQHVPTKDVGWHAGNWYINSKSIGIEHEGFAVKGTWYTEAMYRASAKLVGYLAKRYDIPLDRAHIIGHDNVPGTTPATIPGMHWDPGPYWDWSHYFDLLGAPLMGLGRPNSALVTIDPSFAANRPAFTGCDQLGSGTPCAPRGSEAVVLRTAPSDTASLLTDPGLHPDGRPSTMDVADIGSRVATGQRYAVAGVQGDWTAIWYLGQKGWFRNAPGARTAVPAVGLVATPKPGRATIPVYGRAFPEASAYPANVPVQALAPMPYTLAAGQRYSAGAVVCSEYFSATTFDPAEHVVVRGRTKYVEIQFGHRIEYVDLDDVVLRPAY
ncbi:peptidoglycan recognition family protein [Amycolatopsis sp. PS_44_ISF1]|uniref:peptidoglycan recognition family protein n=1 Tax=Amycolatopsis sp. PS_44_ISF1 TaxID=2974917 RepID=UPI0028DFD8E9|nr:peptidoglycan recognition family protein [Amycolatopsis sp. PS_44_ISF1]MDT8909664.1 N-acetylmuramoyl-L-alanine amidase [Amycolatopsis sp. PS_44_ISF1]